MKKMPNQPLRRKLLAFLCGFPALNACETGPRYEARRADEERRRAEYEALDAKGRNRYDNMRRKFRGIQGLVLRLDAVPSKNEITITTETGGRLAAPSILGPRNVLNMSYTDNSVPVPRWIHVTWREGGRRNGRSSLWEGGTIMGDYTVPIAERIPDEVLDYIRSEKREPYWVGKSVHDGSDIFATPIGRALRVKIRLADDGVLIGWDVEERIQTRYGTGLRYQMAGGDFREVQIRNGKVVEKGWYIDKSGRKVETDY